MIYAIDSLVVGADGIIIGAYGLLYFLSKHKDMQEKTRQAATTGNHDYSQAFIAEAQRFVVQIGSGLTHITAQENVYDGKVIPKGVRAIFSVLVKQTLT